MESRAPKVPGSSPPTLSIHVQHSLPGQWSWKDTPCWYVVQTKPHQEERVIAHLSLRSRAIESFLPKIEIVRRHAGRRIKHLDPLFPTYLFVWMSLTMTTWDTVRWTPGAR